MAKCLMCNGRVGPLAKSWVDDAILLLGYVDITAKAFETQSEWLSPELVRSCESHIELGREIADRLHSYAHGLLSSHDSAKTVLAYEEWVGLNRRFLRALGVTS